MTLSPAIIGSRAEFFVSQTDISIPEVLILRFARRICVKGEAGELWQQLFSVDRDVTDALPSLLSAR
jgi:hypothetical protein